MKDQFIETRGLLFMRCEPEPFTLQREIPCVVKLIQDDSPMGRYNRLYNNQKLDLEIAITPQQLFIEPTSSKSTIRGVPHELFEIVAKHCSEGSSAWALWQMLSGKMVYSIKDPYKILNDNVCHKNRKNEWCDPITMQNWLKIKYVNNWQIYEEPKPEPEVGEWYRNTDNMFKMRDYFQLFSYNEKECQIRQAGYGKYKTVWTDTKEFEQSYELSPIIPDFTDAKVGDECYHAKYGIVRISKIIDYEVHRIHFRNPRTENNYCVDNFGKSFAEDVENPSLFNSVEQCAAYFAEKALREK